jgi:hypothetical protein
MGRPIARRLLESGFKLTAHDRNHLDSPSIDGDANHVGCNAGGAGRSLGLCTGVLIGSS